jgi:wyosine [tRNA(Phe)-imidazoG37] synthetase (radical SAM superfamily)
MMKTFLFHDIIFGPVRSRRLGISLGINLLPENSKLCNFNCIYCECGLTPEIPDPAFRFPPRNLVKELLTERLIGLRDTRLPLDAITFAGNGEPTLHPDFPGVIDDTLHARDTYYPEARVAVLSNASLIHKKEIAGALKKIDFNILKLDSAFSETVRRHNNPGKGFSLEEMLKNLKQFSENLYIQIMYIRGTIGNEIIDNTTDEEVNALLSRLKEINPKQAMVYTIARNTPYPGLKKVPLPELEKIAARISAAGIDVQVSG